MDQREIRIRRLRLQAGHRGFLEAELALRPFINSHLDTLDDAGLAALEELVALEDLDLWEVLCGRKPPPPGVPQALVDRLLAAARPGRGGNSQETV